MNEGPPPPGSRGKCLSAFQINSLILAETDTTTSLCRIRWRRQVLRGTAMLLAKTAPPS